MEQRASALQSRLDARRNMFLKSEQLQEGTTSTNAANPSYGSARPSGKEKRKYPNYCSYSLHVELAVFHQKED
jgi:hypothetical protein